MRRFLAVAGFIPLSVFNPPAGVWPGSIDVKISKQGCEGGVTYNAQVAQTPDLKAKGLAMRKTPLAENEAMLFVLDKELPGFFWMKDTFIPLTLVFFSGDGKLLSSMDMPVEDNPSNPKIQYAVPKNSSMAIEIPAGNSARFKKGLNYRLCVKPLS